MNDSLTKDQFDALALLSRTRKHDRVSACVARNIKTLTGLKYAKYEKDGQPILTEKGQQALFVKRCVEGLRAIADDGLAKLDADVAAFLSRKGHITPRTSAEGFDISQRGRESLADMDATGG